MNELVCFQNPEFGEIRTVEIDGAPWFVGKDVALALGYSNPQKAIRDHVDDEDKGVNELFTPGGTQEMVIINESGLYSLVLSSKLPGAKRFKRWVTGEVIPAIRKQGGYLTPELGAQMEAILAQLGALTARMEALEGAGAPRAVTALAPVGAEALPPAAVPGRSARRRWMQAMNEKLELIHTKTGLSTNAILHQLYLFQEERHDVILDEVRVDCMEALGLESCSVLEAIYRTPKLRHSFEQDMDHNLAPENRGW